MKKNRSFWNEVSSLIFWDWMTILSVSILLIAVILSVNLRAPEFKTTDTPLEKAVHSTVDTTSINAVWRALEDHRTTIEGFGEDGQWE